MWTGCPAFAYKTGSVFSLNLTKQHVYVTNKVDSTIRQR